VAREIMIPRTHIVSLPVNAALNEAIQVIVDSGYSRIPVYHENVDQILGILTAKDILPLWLDPDKEFDIVPLLREAVFVPETKSVKQLLEEMRNRNLHLAVIVDEFGGTSGLVTLEDILEEIIGEIRDEHDMEEDEFIVMDDGSVLTSARANLDDFEERFQVKIPRNGYDTIGGFIIHLMGKVPSRGEEMEFEGLKIKVHGGDRKSITRIVVSNLPRTGEQQIESEDIAAS
jgi:magnesium and cobalt transporter